jgi:hypothetical protein
VFTAIEQRRHELWVPRSLRLAWLLRVFLPGAYRAGAARWDPVPAEVVAAARARAQEALVDGRAPG